MRVREAAERAPPNGVGGVRLPGTLPELLDGRRVLVGLGRGRCVELEHARFAAEDAAELCGASADGVKGPGADGCTATLARRCRAAPHAGATSTENINSRSPRQYSATSRQATDRVDIRL